MNPSTHRRRALATAAAALALALAGTAGAQAPYPAKAITFVVPFAAGSATDQLARALGQSVSTDTRQPVVVDNKAGASGMIAAQAVAKAAPDGYTVLITTNTTHAANEHLYKKLPYDPVKDFAPVTGLGKGGQVLVVNASAPYKSVAELLAAAKKNPGKLSFGSGSSSSRMAGEMLKQLAGVDILHVPYKSNPLAITDLLGGQIDMMITDTSTGVPQIKAGKLRALGYSTQKRGAPHRRGRREGLRHGLLVRRLRARRHARARGGAPQRAAGPRHQERGRQVVLRHRGLRGLDHHARGAGQVPGRRDPEVGQGDQGRGHRARVSAREILGVIGL